MYSGRQAVGCVHWGEVCGGQLWELWVVVQQVTESDSLSPSHSPAHVPLASAQARGVGCDGGEPLPRSCA